MISEKIKYRYNQKKLLIITVSILIFIVSITAVARSSIKFKETASIATSSASIEILMEPEFSILEKRVLLSVSDWVDVPGSQGQESTYQVYYDNLKKYYGSSGIELSVEETLDIEDLINSLNEITYLEKEVQLGKMSFDGREVVIYLLKQIYEISGMNLVMNEAGSIDSITDPTGNIIYQKETQLLQSGFRIDVTIITLMLLASLLGICVILAKKNQILVKGRDYDGFDEKEFA